MIIKVSELPDEGLTVRDVGQLPTPYTDRAWRLDGVSLHLVRDGQDVVAEGEIQATVPQACGRCLEAFPARVNARVDVRLAPRPTGAASVELGADDLDVDFYADDQLDVSTLVETETTLALPMRPLCREDCRGLCPVCGGNRNVTACACETRPTDPRFAVLKELGARWKS